MHLFDFLRAVLAFGVVLGVLVSVHEFGHYLAARWRGVHVEAFSIGFGHPLASWTDRVGTVWKLAWIPLGGYVKLHGQDDPDQVPDDVRAGWLPGRTFHDKPVLSRAIVVAAGPVANFLLAFVLFTFLFATAGRPSAKPEINELVPGGAAAAAGLRPGDVIRAIGGDTTKRFADIQRIVSGSPGRTLAFAITRGGQDQTVPVMIGSKRQDGQALGVLGIRGGNEELQRLPIGPAIVAGAGQTWDTTRQTAEGLWGMITRQRSTDELGGPLRIAQLSGRVAELGIASMISFIAVLSVNLGLINLFPIPILDGGHLIFYLVEALRGRPVPKRAQDMSFYAGFSLLACLFIFATCNDLRHLHVFDWVRSEIARRT